MHSKGLPIIHIFHRKPHSHQAPGCGILLIQRDLRHLRLLAGPATPLHTLDHIHHQLPKCLDEMPHATRSQPAPPPPSGVRRTRRNKPYAYRTPNLREGPFSSASAVVCKPRPFAQPSISAVARSRAAPRRCARAAVTAAGRRDRRPAPRRAAREKVDRKDVQSPLTGEFGLPESSNFKESSESANPPPQRQCTALP